MYRIGVDVGGTFTDFTLLSLDTAEIEFFKVPSTPADPSDAIETGLRQMSETFGFAPENVSYLAHGTTVATNIVIERRGAKTGLMTTKGFRDVLELGRQARPSIYDYRVEKPPVLIPRDRRVEVTERVLPEGEIEQEMDLDSLEAAVELLKADGVESVAICFLHSFRRPEHEQAAQAAVERILPGVYVTLSSEILPEFREFERFSTTAVNAFVGPKMGAYLERFRNRVASVGIPVQPFTIHSNGGLMSIDVVRECPVRTCVSGPAAGVVGAAEIGRLAGLPNLVTFDVGGTSTDVSLIDNAVPLFTNARLVAGYPVKTPMLDIHVIGAGGGSIARLDDAGALKVGPESAGADPGPVAYQLGGTEPTITDANLVLGRLDANMLLGGRLQINLEAARKIIRETIADPLGLPVEEAAHGILQIANANMGRAIRSVSVEKGYDMGDFALCAFGGAGPLHAAEVAQECGLPRILIPREPGTLCARGMLLSDLSQDFVRSHMCDASAEGWQAIVALFEDMEREGEAFLDSEDVAADRRSHNRVLDARYLGQNFEVRVECDGLGPHDLKAVIERFHAAHVKEYGYDIRHHQVQFVSARVQSIGIVVKAGQPEVVGGPDLDQAVIGTRPVYIDKARGWMDTSVFERKKLPSDMPFQGPAIITEMSSTTFILPEQCAHTDRWGNLIVETKA